MARRGDAAVAAEDVPILLESVDELVHGQQAHPCRRQLQPERDPVDSGTHAHHRGGVVLGQRKRLIRRPVRAR